MDVKPITSRVNPLFKDLRSAVVGFSGDAVVVEGTKLIGEALSQGLSPNAVWCCEPPPFRLNCPVYQIPKSMYEQVSPTKNGIGPLAVFPAPKLASLDETAPTSGCYLLLDRIQDPGNAGALVRAGAAFGIDGVIWHKPCAYPFHHAAVRASAGCCFRMKHWTVEQLPELSLPLIGAAGEETAPSLETFNWPKSFILVLGNEGQGISADLRNQIQTLVRIPMVAGVESLNVAGAAHVLMYHHYQQRQFT